MRRQPILRAGSAIFAPSGCSTSRGAVDGSGLAVARRHALASRQVERSARPGTMLGGTCRPTWSPLQTGKNPNDEPRLRNRRRPACHRHRRGAAQLPSRRDAAAFQRSCRQHEPGRPPPDSDGSAERRRTWWRGRLDAIPGLTDLGQLQRSGIDSFDERARCDIAYIRRQSPLADVRLILATLAQWLSPESRRNSRTP